VSDDIVSMLRRQEVGNYNALLWDEAAAEIEVLRSTIRQLQTVAVNAARLKVQLAKALEERDHARRLVCLHTKKTYRTLREEAELRGWSCYKEQKNGRRHR
jgi:hypothetical protein